MSSVMSYLLNVYGHMVIIILISTIWQHSYVYLKQLLPHDRRWLWLINYVMAHTAIRVKTHSKDLAYPYIKRRALVSDGDILLGVIAS